jgi:hypothetical protein
MSKAPTGGGKSSGQGDGNKPKNTTGSSGKAQDKGHSGQGKGLGKSGR